MKYQNSDIPKVWKFAHLKIPTEKFSSKNFFFSLEWRIYFFLPFLFSGFWVVYCVYLNPFMLTKFTAILDDLDLVLVIIYSAFYQFLQLIFHTQNFTNNFSSKKIFLRKNIVLVSDALKTRVNMLFSIALFFEYDSWIQFILEWAVKFEIGR